MYQNYEDYMRSILGYPINPTYEQNTYQTEDFYNYNPTIQFNQSNQELENLYPETYKIIYPMICKICDENRNKELTPELLEEMAKEIYENVETDEQFNINIKTETQSKTSTQNNRQLNRRPNNYLLTDLIKILILRNILGNPRPPRPTRPPFPGNPNFPPSRPPFPGGPGMPPRPRIDY